MELIWHEGCSNQVKILRGCVKTRSPIHIFLLNDALDCQSRATPGKVAECIVLGITRRRKPRKRREVGLFKFIFLIPSHVRRLLKSFPTYLQCMAHGMSIGVVDLAVPGWGTLSTGTITE